jgi:hypothetical protein
MEHAGWKMKIDFNEYEESFYMELTAETVKEANTLIRFSLNVKRDPVDQETFAVSDTVKTQFYFKRRKYFTNDISR